MENAHRIVSDEPLQKGGKTDDFFFLRGGTAMPPSSWCVIWSAARLPRSYGFDPDAGYPGALPHQAGPHRHPGS